MRTHNVRFLAATMLLACAPAVTSPRPDGSLTAAQTDGRTSATSPPESVPALTGGSDGPGPVVMIPDADEPSGADADPGMPEDSSPAASSDGGPPPVTPSVPCSSSASTTPSDKDRPASFVEVDGLIVIEAEHFASQMGYQRVENADASGGAGMQVGDRGTLEFKVMLSAGTYTMYYRTIAPDHTFNSLQANLDGRTLRAPPGDVNAGTVRIIVPQTSTFAWSSHWQGIVHGGKSTPATFEVKEAGMHSFSISKDRKARPIIDRFILSREAAMPCGLQPWWREMTAPSLGPPETGAP